MGSVIIGKTISEGVVRGTANEWATEVTKTREVGCIAGTVSIGLGRLVADFDEENDGTVAVSEPRLPGIADHVCMSVTHSGMVLSRRVADQAAHFLMNGKFAV